MQLAFSQQITVRAISAVSLSLEQLLRMWMVYLTPLYCYPLYKLLLVTLPRCQSHHCSMKPEALMST